MSGIGAGITTKINAALEILQSIPRESQGVGPNSDLPHYDSNVEFLDEGRQIRHAEDRLLKALEDGDQTLYDTLINPASGMPYTEAEKLEALQNAINREINAIESNRPIHPTDQARLDELRRRLEDNKTAHENSSSNSDNKDTTISMADDDDGVRVEHEVVSTEDAVYSQEWGNDNANASVDVLGYEAEAGAFAEFGTDEIEVGAHASASADIVSGEANIEAGPLDAGVAGSAGAEASAEANLEIDPSDGTTQVEIGGEVSIGSEIGVSGGVDLGPIGVEGGFEGKAGIGIDGELDAGVENGKLNFDIEGGITLGLGIGGDIGVSVDLGPVGEGIEEVNDSRQNGWASLIRFGRP